MTDSSNPPAVKATALRMDAITDVAGMIVIAVLMAIDKVPMEWGFGAIVSIVGLMKFDAVRKRGGAIATLLGVAAWGASRGHHPLG